MELGNSIPFSMLLFTLAAGFLLFGGFRLYRKLILPNLLLKDRGHTGHKLFVRIEILVWVLFFAAVIYFALRASFVITLVLFVFVLIAFFDFWRNFFTGLALKFEGGFQVGDTICLNDIKGHVSNFDNQALRLMTSTGEEVLLPYKLIKTAIKIEHKSVPKVLFKSLELEYEPVGFSNFKRKVQDVVYKNPWIIISKPIDIAVQDGTAVLSFYVLNNDLFEKAKQRLLKDLA